MIVKSRRLASARWTRFRERNDGLGLAARLIMKSRKLMILAVIGSLAGAVLEGSTMGILALSLKFLEGNGYAAVQNIPLIGRWAAVVSDGGNNPRNGFLLLVGLAMATQVVKSGVQFGSTVVSAYLRATIEKDVHLLVFQKVVRAPFEKISRLSSGEIAALVAQMPRLSILVTALHSMVRSATLSCAYLAVLVWISATATIAATAFLLAVSVFVMPLVRRLRLVSKEYIRATGSSTAQYVDYVNAGRIIRVFNREDEVTRKMETLLERWLLLRRTGEALRGSITPVIQIASILGVGFILFLGVLLAGQKWEELLSNLIIFLIVVYRLIPEVGSLNDSRAKLADSIPVWEKVDELLSVPEEERSESNKKTFDGLRERIEFRDVSLRYDDEIEAVSGASFSIEKEEMVAIVGVSGAGKSTIADLLVRLYEPTGGQIIVDGVDLMDIEISSWRKYVAMVDQDTVVMNATIAENILFGRSDASMDEVRSAAQVAHCQEFIERLGQGYDTIVGERGYRLSGGQRQRIALARAILRRPSILILDEATSELDSISDNLIRRSIFDMKGKVTLVVIAHRMTTIRDADKILVVHQGRVVESGRHEELMKQAGKYMRLWRLQIDSGTVA